MKLSTRVQFREPHENITVKMNYSGDYDYFLF